MRGSVALRISRLARTSVGCSAAAACRAEGGRLVGSGGGALVRISADASARSLSQTPGASPAAHAYVDPTALTLACLQQRAGGQHDYRAPKGTARWHGPQQPDPVLHSKGSRACDRVPRRGLADEAPCCARAWLHELEVAACVRPTRSSGAADEAAQAEQRAQARHQLNALLTSAGSLQPPADAARQRIQVAQLRRVRAQRETAPDFRAAANALHARAGANRSRGQADGARHAAMARSPCNTVGCGAVRIGEHVPSLRGAPWQAGQARCHRRPRPAWPPRRRLPASRPGPAAPPRAAGPCLPAAPAGSRGSLSLCCQPGRNSRCHCMRGAPAALTGSPRWPRCAPRGQHWQPPARRAPCAAPPGSAPPAPPPAHGALPVLPSPRL